MNSLKPNWTFRISSPVSEATTIDSSLRTSLREKVTSTLPSSHVATWNTMVTLPLPLSFSALSVTEKSPISVK